MRVGAQVLIAAPLFPRVGLDEPSNRVRTRCHAGIRAAIGPGAHPGLDQAHEIDSLITVPTVLAQILNLPSDVRPQYDTLKP